MFDRLLLLVRVAFHRCVSRRSDLLSLITSPPISSVRSIIVYCTFQVRGLDSTFSLLLVIALMLPRIATPDGPVWSESMAQTQLHSVALLKPNAWMCCCSRGMSSIQHPL